MEELGADFCVNIQRNTHRYLELFSRAVDMITPVPSPQVCRYCLTSFKNNACLYLLGISDFE